MSNAALIERLQKLTGPCRETDALVAIAIGAPPAEFEQVAEPGRSWLWVKYLGGSTPDFNCWEAPAYTGSVDAALTLVPRGWIVDTHRGFDDDGEYWSKVILIDSFSIGRGRDHDERREFIAYGGGDTPRFICIATLKAREALYTDESGGA